MNRLFITILLILLPISISARDIKTLEIKDSPISEFIQWASDQSGKNIIVGKGVEGRVSVSIRDLKSEDLMYLFERVITANGYALRSYGGIYQVTLPEKEEPSTQPLNSKVFMFENLENKKAKTVIQSLLDAHIQNNQKPLVEVLPTSNAILVSASAEHIKIIDSFISSVDQSASQVLIEAIIMETDLIDSKDIGVNLSSALSNNGFTFIQNSMTSITDIQTLGLGGHAVLSQGGNLRGLLSALISNSNTKILSTPQILVMDREQGYISVGQNVPFLVSTEVTDGGNSIQNIERRDVGVSLTVTPHVLASGEIVLQISQESSSVANSTQAADLITNKRSIATVARVADGQTLLLGGLVSDEERAIESGVPVLKDVPWLGALFRSQSSEKAQKELTMMIRTTVL